MKMTGEAVKTIYLTITLAAMLGASAQAQMSVKTRYSRDFNLCMNDSGGGDAAIIDCNSSEIDRQDARLTQAYVMVMRRLSEPQHTALRQSEREWIKQRDATCTRKAKPEMGGTLYNVVYGSCILDETIKRTIFLEKF